MAEFPSTADSYQLCHPVGKGSTANVWHAKCVPLNKEVAIKIIDLENCPSNLEEIRKEIQLMRLCSHPNLVSYRSSFIHHTSLWLVMDYLSGGSLYDIMHYSQPQGFRDEVLIATVLHEALCGIEYLHSTGRIHRDVKAGNLLVHEDGSIKVGDFGVSAWLVEEGMKRSGRQTFVGTPCWMAPEVMEQVHGYDYKADIWSLGITALELAQGHAPLARYAPMKVLLLTLQNPSPTLGEEFSRPFRDFVDTCLNKDPAKRPTASKLLEHKFFKMARKADYVKSLLNGLPPLWERIKSQVEPPAESETPAQDQPTSWNFEDGELMDTIVQGSPQSSVSSPSATELNRSQQQPQQQQPQQQPQQQTQTSTTSHTPAGNTGSTDPAHKVQVKGRFNVKTVASKSNLANTHTEEGGEAKETEQPRGPGLIDPMYLMTELQKQVSAIMKENETLKAQNAQLRKELASFKNGNTSAHK